MTKMQMIAYIQTALKWAMEEGNKEALEAMQCKILGYGFGAVSGWKWTHTKEFIRLRAEELMEMMLEIVECMY